MENNKLGQEPAFPIIEERYDGVSQVFKQECVDTGMSKRFYAACAAMQGILSSSDLNNLQYSFEKVIPKLAFMYADELLKQENL